MKKYQKTAIAALSSMAMLLASVPAVFADEALTLTNPSSQEVQTQQQSQAQEINIFAQNSLREYFNGGYSTDIYLSGKVTFRFNPLTTGEYVFKVEDMIGNLKGDGRVIVSDYGTKSITLENLYGYHKIVAYSPNGYGGSYDIYY
ncbi:MULTISPECIES: hypothetical protein [unclassified Paenibacillus]|uniref:hypothetical protein n=1 Tax=unclassified Paenibacillus TaxID=185978 RepID=UPI000CFB9E22|nr:MULTISPECIES: hypothetical protein [unclassified Paenibacillus]PRA07274.1 hypothetical protein CQ043_07695 [Paenibacillus sp. MYb63]PRA50918.1 hypothetical protein CQ061_00850 [Paenibacillus sp. MYb67]QZN74051.1 hypothetical protein K5K90_21820 [Paenibacillus sp. DR312]